jgi:predicted nucleic acid-binding protein
VPSTIVIDASFTFRYFVPGPDQQIARSQVKFWEQRNVELRAPTLWAYELTSTLVKAVHFRQMEQQEAKVVLSLVFIFPVKLVVPDDELSHAAYDWSLRLQRAQAYDSFYVALAQSLGCELWTADQRLYRAVNQPWVHYLGEETNGAPV